MQVLDRERKMWNNLAKLGMKDKNYLPLEAIGTTTNR